jgi:hypothetical protein
MPPGEMPLYLHIVAKSQVVLDAAVREVQTLIDQELAPLIEERTLIARARATGQPLPPSAAPPVRQKWPEERLFIELEPMRNFNIRAKVVGPGVSVCGLGDWNLKVADSRWQQMLGGKIPSTNSTGHVCKVHPGRDGCARADQGTRIGLHGERHGAGVERADAHQHCVSVTQLYMTNI